MTDLFFYGTLCHTPLLEVVLGHPVHDIDMLEAVLEDHAVQSARNQIFPIIVPAPGQRVSGLLVRGLSAEDITRLEFYKGCFAFGLADLTVSLPDGSTARAGVFFPEADKWQPGALWSLSDLTAEWGELTVLAAQEVMAFFGRLDASHVARSFTAIRMRAWARMAAAKRTTGEAQDVTNGVEVQRRGPAYLDYFGIEEIELRHRQYDGSMGPLLRRNALMTGQAVVLLPYDPKRDAVLLVEQFRTPVYLIGDPEPWMWEPVAGMIDPGETPEAAARRETLEEAHLGLDRLEFAGGAYSSSGSSTEYLHLYVGLGDLTRTVDNGGVADEGEDIRSQILSFDDLMALVDSHKVKDLPLLSLAHWLARNRDRLRAGV